MKPASKGPGKESGRVLKREQWLDLARKLDWTFSYVHEKDVYPEELSGTPWLASAGLDEEFIRDGVRGALGISRGRIREEAHAG